MTIRVGVAILAAILTCPLWAGAPVLAKETFSFAYLQRVGDSHYERHRAYTGLALRDQYPPVDGARVALRDSRLIGRSLGIGFELLEAMLAKDEEAPAAIRRLMAEQNIRVFLLDLPIEEVVAAAAALARKNVILFNLRHRADALRGEHCAPVLFHTIPSHAMLMDGLAQYLFKKNWTEVLVLESEAEADKTLSAAFQESARKFRLEVVDVRPFVLSNDPRERDQNNIALLTGEADYDVIFLADTAGEFGRYLPFNSYLPRPVIGSEGLVAGAWHWTWERHGAPQLNQRFDRRAKRRMAAEDWAAWAAVRSVVEAIARSGSTDPAALRAFLTSEDVRLDLYKGVPGSFRSWDNQLRQSILLHTHNAVTARAPIEGFLHEKNDLDTLGADARETECRMD
jgi:ABC transporter substrate binding protein (PQQ-dependent alcohol dehydrogenase system)